MSNSYEDWLFQDFETTDTKTPAADVGSIDRNIARYYYQGYSGSEIDAKMNIDKASTILQRLQAEDDQLRKFLAGMHDRNRALRMWALDVIETPGAYTTEDEVKAMNKRNVVRHFLQGLSVDAIAETVRDAVAILKDLETESPSLHAFIHQRNEIIKANKAHPGEEPFPFDVGTETEVFLWNTQRYTLETFEELLQFSPAKAWWRQTRTLPNSKGLPKYHLFTPEKMQKKLDQQAEVDFAREEEAKKRQRKLEERQERDAKLLGPIEQWHKRNEQRKGGGTS
jgi:hypothetical protein